MKARFLFLLIVLSPVIGFPVSAQVQNLKDSEIKTVTTIKSQAINLHQPGKVVVLDFFMTTCPHCQLHAPHMAEVARKYAGRLLVVSFAADGKAQPALLEHYIKQYGVTNPVVNLTNEMVANFLPKVRDVPQMLLYDQNGNLVKTILGWTEDNKQLLDNYLNTLLPKPKARRK